MSSFQKQGKSKQGRRGGGRSSFEVFFIDSKLNGKLVSDGMKMRSFISI